MKISPEIKVEGEGLIKKKNTYIGIRVSMSFEEIRNIFRRLFKKDK